MQSFLIGNQMINILQNFSHCTVFHQSEKYFDRKIGLLLNHSILVVEQNNYVKKIINVHIDLDNWPINLLSNFVLQIACMM